MPRVPDLGITVGLLPPGPTGSVLDVPGPAWGTPPCGGTSRRPPAGRGTARTGVTVIDPGGDLFRFPVPAGGAVLSGAGECTGMLAAQEWGLAETPVFLTSTMQLGRVYDAACELLIERAARDRRRGRDHPGRGRVRRQFPQRKPPDAGAAGRRAGGAGGGPGVRGDGGRGRGRGGRGNRDELPGLQGRHRHRVPGGAGGATVGVVTMTNFGDGERLAVAGAGRAAAAGSPPRRRGGEAAAGAGPAAGAAGGTPQPGRVLRPAPRREHAAGAGTAAGAAEGDAAAGLGIRPAPGRDPRARASW